MKIELFYIDGCPSYHMAEDLLREVLAEAKISGRIELIEIKTETDAQRWKFPGSPTIRFDGVDPFAQDTAIYGLECRIYLTPAGLRGWPTKDMLREAVNNVARLQGDPLQVHPA